MLKQAEGAMDTYFYDCPWADETQYQAWKVELALVFEDALWDALYRFKREKATVPVRDWRRRAL